MTRRTHSGETTLQAKTLQFERFQNAPKQKRIVIIGGGRWARVWAQVACHFIGKGDQLWMMSEHNTSELEALFATKDVFEGKQTRVLDTQSFTQTPAQPKACIAIVGSNSSRHTEQAELALSLGYHVLVEKPVALEFEHARALVTYAEQQRLQLGVNRHLAFAVYLHQLKELIETRLTEPMSVELNWMDPALEKRHGAVKRPQYDMSLPQDIYPHVYAICETLFGVEPQIDGARASRGGLCLSAEGTVAGNPFSLHMEQQGKERLRFLRIKDAKNAITLDFSNEPGLLMLNDTSIPTDGYWRKFPSPLALSLGQFITASEGNIDNTVNLGARVLSGLDAAQELQQAVAQHQRELIAQTLKVPQKDGPLEDTLQYALLSQFSNWAGNPKSEEVSRSSAIDILRRLELGELSQSD